MFYKLAYFVIEYRQELTQSVLKARDGKSNPIIELLFRLYVFYRPYLANFLLKAPPAVFDKSGKGDDETLLTGGRKVN